MYLERWGVAAAIAATVPLIPAGAEEPSEPALVAAMPDFNPHWQMAGHHGSWRVYEQMAVDAGRLQRMEALASTGDFGQISVTIERNLGRKRKTSDMLGMRRERVSSSSIKFGYETDPDADGRLWLSAGMSAQRRRLLTNIVGGRILNSGEASFAAGWVQDRHWQLSARYLVDQANSRRAGWRRGIELASGARPSANSMIAGISFSPDFDRPDAARIGLEARRDRLGAADADAMAMNGRERSSLVLSLRSGF